MYKDYEEYGIDYTEGQNFDTADRVETFDAGAYQVSQIVTPLKKFTKDELFPGVSNVKHMMVYVLNKVGCFSHEEIAEQLGLAVGSIKKIVWRLSTMNTLD